MDVCSSVSVDTSQYSHVQCDGFMYLPVDTSIYTMLVSSVRMSGTRSLEHPTEHLTESCPRAQSACDLAWIIR